MKVIRQPHSLTPLQSAFFLCFLLFTAEGHSQQSLTTVVINDNFSSKLLSPHMEYLLEPSGKLSIQDVRQDVFQAYGPGKVYFGYPEGAIWFRFTLQNDSSKDTEILLNSHDAFSNSLDLYLLRESEQNFFHHSAQGTRLSSRERPLKSVNMVFPIAIKTGETLTAYYRVSSLVSTRVNPELTNYTRFIAENSNADKASHAFYGVIMGLLAFNIFLAFMTREKPYFYYTAFLACSIIYYGLFDGYAFFYWPDPWWTDGKLHLFYTSGFLSNGLFAFFTLRYLNLYNSQSWMATFQKLLALFSIFGIALQPFCDLIILRYYFIASVVIMSMINPIISFMLWRKGSAFAGIYLLAFVGYYAAVLLTVATTLFESFVAPIMYKDYTQFGYLWQIIGLSIGLGYRIKFLKEENIRNREDAIVANAQAKFKGEFLAKMSHEIRTPMNGVLGMAELLGESKQTEDQQRYTQIIQSSGKTLLSVINDILDYSKIEVGEVRVEKIDVNLQNLLTDLRNLFSIREKQTGVELTCIIEPDVPLCISGDPVRLQQILTNFIGNAYKFTDKGSIHVEIALDKDRTNRLLFSVTDTGIGISSAQQSSIFDYYNQASNSVTREYGGTGLGLAICKHLAYLMEGDIGVTSARNEGACFWVSLPLIPAKNQISEETIDIESLRDKHILLIDDDEQYCEFVQRQLARWHIKTSLAHSGEEGLKILWSNNTDPIDLLITDLHMPGMNGIETARTIHTQKEFSYLPLVLMTATGTHPDSQTLSSAGISLSADKPVSAFDMGNLLCRILLPSTEDKPNIKQQLQPAIVALSILVAEDNKTNQQVINGMLKKLGHRCVIANNGKEAVNRFTTNPHSVDLILMDYEMPILNGVEATKVLRQYEMKKGLDATPIIALTAHALQDHQKDCIESGMDAVMIKPITLKALSKTLDQLAPRVSSRSDNTSPLRSN